jgi:DNA-binding PadR family transcriptional regulator
MSVKMAVLGLVIERPGYGYELRQRLDERVEGLQLSDSAVYPALESLWRTGLIRKRDRGDSPHHKRDGHAHRPRVWYEKTDQGIEVFNDWMDAPSELAPLRGSLRLKIAVATIERLPKLIEETREQEQALLDRIEGLTRAHDPVALLDSDEWAGTGRLVLRRTDVKLLQAEIEALQEVRAEMKRALRRHAARVARSSE